MGVYGDESERLEAGEVEVRIRQGLARAAGAGAIGQRAVQTDRRAAVYAAAPGAALA